MLSWHSPPLLQGSETQTKKDGKLQFTFEPLVGTCNASGQGLTWFAVIDVRFTLLASVTCLALALVATHGVEAHSTIAARMFYTFVYVDFTRLTCCLRKQELWKLTDMQKHTTKTR